MEVYGLKKDSADLEAEEKMNDMISVVTICLNSEAEIEKTLKSVLEQDYKFIEYIIKDGNSVDKTNEIIRRYRSDFQKKGIQFKHIISSDHGIYDAMNIAVENCHGDWVIFMNSGDTFYNQNVISDIFRQKNWKEVDALYGHTLFQLSEGQGLIVNHNINFLEEGWSLCHQSLFVRRELLLKFPFDCQYKIVADYEQVLRLKREGRIFKKVNVIISNVNREGFSCQCIALRYKENNQLKEIYNLKFEKQLTIIGYIKQIIKKIFYKLEVFCFVRASIKRIMRFESNGR